MKITVAALAYNEIKYIPYMVDYYHSQGCDLFIVDNYSNDGTYEWLIENNIPTIRVDTDESFHLTTLQTVLNEQLKIINPDWVVYTGIDIFYHFEGTIREEIEKVDAKGYNIIRNTTYFAYNTGEDFTLPFYSTYFYIDLHGTNMMISKYGEGFEILADEIQLNNKSIYNTGFMINYGMCKPKEEREETYKRRQKAWNLGLSRVYGTHYIGAQKKQWIWEKEELSDIRTMEEWRLITKDHSIL
jgi:glycosyltransferase involved in cell wall biosynthesis